LGAINKKTGKIIVFGGSGFLGSYIVDQLVEAGYDAFAADLKVSNKIPTHRFIKCDILNETLVNEIISDAEVVFNFAGYANLENAIKNPYETISLNVMGNINILEAVRNNNVNRYIFASSAYAMNNKASFYGISKLASEKIIEEYQKQYDLNYTIIRFGSIYSEEESDNNYLYKVVKEAVQSNEINHPGDGEEIREYIHAEDAARLAINIMEDEDYERQHIILTGSERFKRFEIFQMIKEILGKEITIRLNKDGYDNHYNFTPYQYQPSISKKLIANPYIDLGQGILRCIQNVENSKY
jgi:UDP-glucose 4-epimerase